MSREKGVARKEKEQKKSDCFFFTSYSLKMLLPPSKGVFFLYLVLNKRKDIGREQQDTENTFRCFAFLVLQ